MSTPGHFPCDPGAPSRAYAELATRFSRIARLGDALGILDWDHQTMMPEGAAPARAEVLATLQVIRHELLTAPRLSDLLDAAEAAEHDPWRCANLREMRRLWVHATAVPADLVAARARAASACEIAWRAARRDSDFPALLPLLGEGLALERQAAVAKAQQLGVAPYDALLDAYEPGARLARIEPLFDDLAAFLPEFTAAVVAHQADQPVPTAPHGPFAEAAQRTLGLELMAAIGFDFSRGRLDISLHPFCGGATDDVRITTRYDESDAMCALMGVLHETGHAVYEQGLPRAWLDQPVGTARGMAVHESQSLIIEMQAGRSRPFLGWLAQRLAAAFGNDPAWASDNLYRLCTRVAPSFIRVDADEVTYPAHVILRTRLEQALLAGDLLLADLPAAWNDGMRALLGIVPPSDALGCLQDIHWPSGAWGYFPTYTLGAMTAAQLFDAACRADAEVLPGLGRCDFGPLLGWLRREVHTQGSRLDSDDLLTAATGQRLNAEIFKAHLRHRYLEE